MGDNAVLKGNKLFKLLALFSKKELNQLNKWLDSKFHNNSDDVRMLFEGLKQHYGKFEKTFDKQLLLKYMNYSESNSTPKKEDAALRSVMFKLTQQLQDFLVYLTLQKSPQKKELLLLESFMERKHFEQASSVIQKSKKNLVKQKTWEVEDLEHQFHLDEIQFSFEVLTNNRGAHLQIQNLLDSLNRFTVVRILKYYCAARNIENIRKIEIDLAMRNEIMGFLEDSPLLEIPLIKSYSLLLQLLEDGEDRHYYELKKFLIENLESYSLPELRQILNHLTNFCIRKRRQGQLEFLQEIHEMYQIGLKLECWSAGVYFSVHQYIRIIQNRLDLNKISEAAEFADTYSEKLDPNNSQSVQTYAKALIAYWKQEFDFALDLMNQIENTDDFIYHLRFKILRVRIFYESKEYLQPNRGKSMLEYELDAIRHFVISGRNKKLSEHLRTGYSNFVNLFKRVLKRAQDDANGKKVTEKTREKLLSDLEAIGPLIERNWLIDRIQAL